MNRFIKFGLISIILSGYLFASDMSQAKPSWPEIEKDGLMLEPNTGVKTSDQVLADNSPINEDDMGAMNIPPELPNFNSDPIVHAQENKHIDMLKNDNTIIPNDISKIEKGDINDINLDRANKEEFLKQRRMKIDKDREKSLIEKKVNSYKDEDLKFNEKSSLIGDGNIENESTQQILKELKAIKSDMKTKEASYDKMIKSLFEPEKNNESGSVSVDGSTIMGKGKTKEEKELDDKKNKQKIEEKKKEMNELTKLMLPSPQKAINIGNKYILFASYKEEKLSDPKGVIKGKDTIIEDEDDKTKIKSDNLNDLMSLEEELSKFSMKNKFALSDIELSEKTIKIEVGHRFGDWVLSKIEMNQIVYENTKTKEIVRKFY